MFCQASPLESAGKRDGSGIKSNYSLLIVGKRVDSSRAGRTILDFFLQLLLISAVNFSFLCGGSACEYKSLKWL
jgi:hypothetical protein